MSNNRKNDKNFISINDKIKNISENFTSIDNKIKNLDDAFNNNIKSIKSTDTKFESIDNKIQNKDKKIKIINNKIKNIKDKIKSIENKINSTDDEFASINNKFKEIDDKFKSIDNKLKNNNEFSSINNKIKITDDKIKDIDDKINKLEITLGMKAIVWEKEYLIFKNLMNNGITKYFHKKIKKYNLLYLASRDGYEVEYFHEKCDGKRFTVILVLTEKKIFGGFTELEWDKKDIIGSKKGDKGFLFSVNKDKIYYNKKSYTILNYSWIGPNFGHAGFQIYSYFGYDYTASYGDFDISGGEYALAGEEKFSIRDYAVYQIDLE